MHCLLCHEKIPRLRVWRTKSEFCCEEHAALYKKQTLERLLVDPNAVQNGGQSSLPEPPEPVEFEFDEMDRGAADEAGEMAEANAEIRSWERHDSGETAEDLDEDLPQPAGIEPGEGVDELWRLADEVGSGDGAGYPRSGSRLPSEPPEVNRQSADDALEALRQLAKRSAPRNESSENEARPKVFELPGIEEEREFATTDELFEELERKAMLRELQGDLDDPKPPSAPASPGWEVEPAMGAPAEELEEDSILEQLMAESPLPREDESPSIEAFDDDVAATPPEVGEPADEPPALSIEASAGADVSFEAPEPDWDFADASSELSALKSSLESSGSPAVIISEPSVEELSIEDDAMPLDPDWEALEGLDLSDAEIEPPEPEVADGKSRAVLAEAATPPELDEDEPEQEQAAAAADAAETAGHGADVPARRSMTSRIRGVWSLLEIEAEMADWEGASTAREPEPKPDLVAAEAEGCRLPAVPAALGPRAHAIKGSDSVLTDGGSPAAAESASLPGEADQPKVIEPRQAELLFPAGLVGASLPSSGPSMYHGSVDIEPVAFLDEDSTDNGPALLAGMDIPVEPAGLFFDLGGAPAPEFDDADEDDYVDAEAAAGAGRESS